MWFMLISRQFSAMKAIARVAFSGTFIMSGWGAVSDSVAKETVKYNDAVMKLQIARDSVVEQQRQKSITVLQSLAKTRSKNKDQAGTTAAWRAILRLDRKHEEAVAYFTAEGTLETVLKELDAKPEDLLGGNP
jgi:hypothetical protein